MKDGYHPVADVISQRRSVRRFGPEPVARGLVRELVALACRAPAPHKSRPWRFAYVATDGAKERLAEAMSGAWLADLEAAGTPVRDVQRLISRSKIAFIASRRGLSSVVTVMTISTPRRPTI